MKIESHHSHIEEHKKDRNAQMVNNNNNNNNNDIVIDNDKNYKKKLKEELEGLYNKIKVSDEKNNISSMGISMGIFFLFQDLQNDAADTTLEKETETVGDVSKLKISTKKLLKGHINKVNSVHYSGDNR